MSNTKMLGSGLSLAMKATEFARQFCANPARNGKLRGSHFALLLIVLVTLCFGLSSRKAQAQSTTGDIVGTVTDISGAVVPDATVTLLNTDTNITAVTKSNSVGDYGFSSQNPGHYTLQVNAPGFKRIVVANVQLSAGDRLREDAKLATGSTSETVEVTSAPLALQTDSSVVGSSLTEEAVQNLPLNGRNFVSLAQLAPGANEGSPLSTSSGTRPDDRRQTSAVSVNGQSDLVNDEMIDGMDNNERLIGTIGVRPSIDAIQELRIDTNSYTADVGRTAAAAINIITASGTNQYHGTLYEYFRNDKLNAYAFQFGAHNPKTELRQNQFGGSIGGPIFKDRTFFFADIEELRNVHGSAPSSNPVPTLYEEQHPGDFSDAIPANCAVATGPSSQTTGCVYDQTTGLVIPSNIVPTSQLDSVGLLYFQLYPAPNVGTNKYVGSKSGTQFSTVYDIRLDHKLGQKDLSNGRYTENIVHTYTPTAAFPAKKVAGILIDGQGGGFAGNSPEVARNAQLNEKHSFTSNLLTSVSLAYTNVFILSTPVNYGLNPNTAFGQPGINFSTNTSGLAAVTVTGGTNLGMGGEYIPLEYKDNTFQVLGSVMYNKGHHIFQFGSGFIYRQAYNYQDNAGEGVFAFQNGLPGLVSGYFSSATRNNQLYPPHYRTSEPNVYAEDNWHVAQKLTLNLGIRWDAFTPYSEITNHISDFDLSTGVMNQAGVNGINKYAGLSTTHTNFAPRIGFAYTLRPGTVFRGGYGISFYPGAALSNGSLKNQPNVVTYGACTSASNTAACPTTYNRLARGLPIPLAANASATNLSGSIPAVIDRNFRTSYIEQFNLTAQQEYRQNTITISYIGSLGRHLPDYIPDVNRVPLGGTARRFASQYPNMSAIQALFSDGASNYNAVQAGVERRFSNGLGYNVYGALAKSIDDVTQLDTVNVGNGQVLATTHHDDHGLSDIAGKGRFVITGNYAIPYKKGSNAFKNAALSGWKFNVINLWSTGAPFTVLNASNVSGTSPNGSADRSNYAGGGKISKPTIGAFFNTAAFTKQTAGTLGTEKKGVLYGPNYRHADASVFKAFDAPRETTFEFRAECFNIANQTNWANPNVTVGNSTFGTITSTQIYYQPRQFQFSLRLSY